MSDIYSTIKEIEKNKNLEINLPKYANYLMSHYNRYSNIRLAMNYYTFAEVMDEADNKKSDLVKPLFERVKKVVKTITEPSYNLEDAKDNIAELEDVRNTVMKEMQVITTYTDNFTVYEYILNRIEHRYDETFTEFDNTEFAADILRYIVADKDQNLVNLKITEIVRQLPVRMTKNKFYELLKTGLSIYKGSDQSNVNDFIYLLRTSALLMKPENFDKGYEDLKSILTELENTDYKTIDAQTIRELFNKIHYAAEYLEDVANIYMMLQEVINDLYVVLLSKPYAITDTEESDTCADIITYVDEEYASDKKEHDLDEKITELLMKLEGKQEQIYESISKNGYMLADIKESHSDLLASIVVDKIYNSLYLIEKLTSSSIFIELDRDEEESKKADDEYINRVTDELINEFAGKFENCAQVMTRAIIAMTISQLPVFFNSMEEVQNYVVTALEVCKDKAEREACHEVLYSMMYEEM